MLRFGSHHPEIHKAAGCPHCALTNRLRDPIRARQWLAQLATDPAAITAMRRLLQEDAGLSDVTGLPDSEVIQALADLLGQGAFHAHAPSSYLEFGNFTGPAPSSAPAKQAPYPLSERQARAPSARPTVADPATFGPNLDAAAQAATLRSASAQGKPFCPE